MNIETNADKPAFPQDQKYSVGNLGIATVGLTKREYVATAILQSWIIAGNEITEELINKSVIEAERLCYICSVAQS